MSPKIWYADQIAALVIRGPSDASRQFVSLGEYRKLEDALRLVRDFQPVVNGDYAVMEAIPALRKIAIGALGSPASGEFKL
jgi:hypothetical protein